MPNNRERHVLLAQEQELLIHVQAYQEQGKLFCFRKNEEEFVRATKLIPQLNSKKANTFLKRLKCCSQCFRGENSEALLIRPTNFR